MKARAAKSKRFEDKIRTHLHSVYSCLYKIYKIYAQN